jgi:hypothetical protein
MDAYQADALFTRLFEGWRLDEMFPPVGSAPYVRRLRDQAAVAVLGGSAANRHSTDHPGPRSLVAANEMIRALGYDPPGEVNAQPESSTIPLHCPRCNETTAGYLTTDVIFPHPTESMFRCGNPECGARWRVEFFEVEGEDT